MNRRDFLKTGLVAGAATVAAPKGYLDRNHDIVDAADVLIAAPSGTTEKRRSGTWATVRYARKLGRTICVVLPDGVVRTENV